MYNQTARPDPSRYLRAIVAVVALTTVTAAGCSGAASHVPAHTNAAGTPTRPMAPPASSTATPRTSGGQASTPSPVSAARSDAPAAGSAALASYRAFVAATVEAFAHPGRDHRRLRKFGWGSALAGAYGQVSWYRRRHIHLTGAPSIHPRVLAATDTRTRIADCVDDSRWIPVDGHGRPRAASHRPHQHPVTATARQLSGRWYVTAMSSHRGRSC